MSAAPNTAERVGRRSSSLQAAEFDAERALFPSFALYCEAKLAEATRAAGGEQAGPDPFRAALVVEIFRRLFCGAARGPTGSGDTQDTRPRAASCCLDRWLRPGCEAGAVSLVYCRPAVAVLCALRRHRRQDPHRACHSDLHPDGRHQPALFPALDPVRSGERSPEAQAHPVQGSGGEHRQPSARALLRTACNAGWRRRRLGRRWRHAHVFSHFVALFYI